MNKKNNQIPWASVEHDTTINPHIGNVARDPMMSDIAKERSIPCIAAENLRPNQKAIFGEPPIASGNKTSNIKTWRSVQSFRKCCLLPVKPIDAFQMAEGPYAYTLIKK